MHCLAIIEAAKRASKSDHKEKLIVFFENKSKDILLQLDIPTTSELNNWNGEDWIKNLNEENPLITSVLLDEFENSLSDVFTEYAICQDFIAGHEFYELCGVFWCVHHDDYELEGPSIDRDNLW